MKNREYYKITCPVGEISSVKLRQIVLDCISLGLETFQIGSRQELIIPLDTSTDISNINNRLDKFNFTKPGEIENIVSSFASFEILPATSWVNDETYKGFSYFINSNTKLKINIVDPKQNLIPLFSGNINLIASEKENQWILVLNLPEQKMFYQIPYLIADYKVVSIIETIEQLILDLVPIDTDLIDKKIAPFLTETKCQEDYITSLQAQQERPIYEGFHPINENMVWLGIYNHNNIYQGEFLEELAFLCSQQNIGSIFFTCNQSIIIKYIDKENILLWKKLIQKYNINLRHSRFILNCQIDNFDDESLELKKYIYKQLSSEDKQLANLPFAITNSPWDHDASIFISPVDKFSPFSKYYNIYYSNEFNPISKQLILYKNKISKKELFSSLLELTLIFHQDSFNVLEESLKNKYDDGILTRGNKTKIQCPDCLTIYEPVQLGFDENAKIDLASIPDDFKCYICENDKKDLQIITI